MASVDEEFQVAEAPRSWLLLRPNAVLMSLPVEYRWEFTRRHPYYLQWWELARKFHEQPSGDMREQIAAKILGGIGVAESMAPLAPKLGPEALGTGDLGGAWTGGAVAPAMLRTLAITLLAALPAPQRFQLGRLLCESAEYESSDSPQMGVIASRLALMKEPAWDSYPKIPVVSINLEMPQRAINEAIEELVRTWKAERNITERRRRDDKLDEYLKVWDLREGWSAGTYEGSREKTFREIAQETKTSIQTLIDRYRTAFRYLSGHDYTRELWIRLMGPYKLPRHVVQPGGLGVFMRRPWRSPQPRPVTESVLLPGRTEFEKSEFIAAAGVTPSETSLVDLSLDIATLLERGRTDAEIIEELELAAPWAADLITELRQRHEQS